MHNLKRVIDRFLQILMIPQFILFADMRNLESSNFECMPCDECHRKQ